MNNRYPYENNNINAEIKTDSNIDLISFDRRKRAAQIIANEDAAREKRRRILLAKRRAEMLRRARIEQIKSWCILCVCAIGALCIIIGIIVGIVKAINGASSNKSGNTPDNAVSASETKLVTDFASFSGNIYSEQNNEFIALSDKMLSEVISAYFSSGIPATSNLISDYAIISERYCSLVNASGYEDFRNAVKSTPIFSNGYVWSQTDSMKFEKTGGYLYDTNTSFIIAVSNICLIEGSTAFLNEIDTDAQPRKDFSKGKTVGEKLQMAIDYLFDGNIVEGGIKFDTISSLCYIHTEANNGTSSGHPSNRWFNFRFGYLDAYSNISFNKAMQKLSQLCTLKGETENAHRYASVAQHNAKSFSEELWDSQNKRFIGCVDKNSNDYDYGFVFLNLEAIANSMTTSEQAKDIFSWLDAERIIESDTSVGPDIYSYGFAPRNTTLKVEDKWWDYMGGTLPLSENAGYGKYYQNGGVSLSTAYYDILARYYNDDIQGAKSRLVALLNEYKNTGFTYSDTSVYDVSLNAANAVAYLAPAKCLFNINTDGLRLSVSPDLSIISNIDGNNINAKNFGAYGIKNVAFSSNTYGFLFDSDKTYVISTYEKPVRLNIGGFTPEVPYSIITVSGGLEISESTFTALPDGTVSVTAEFGADSYIRIEKSE